MVYHCHSFSLIHALAVGRIRTAINTAPPGSLHFCPHFCVGFFVFGCALPRPPASYSSCLLLLLPPPPPTQLTHTQLPHTHDLLTHATYSHTTCSYTTCSHTHNLLTHTQLTHTELAHTQLAHTHTTCSHTHCSHTHTQTHTQAPLQSRVLHSKGEEPCAPRCSVVRWPLAWNVAVLLRLRRCSLTSRRCWAFWRFS